MELALNSWLNGSGEISSSRLERVGRDGWLSLGFERRDGRTVLTDRAFTLPLQVTEPLSLDQDGSLLVMLLNPTGGLVGGDCLRTQIRLGPGSHVCLTTPSATKAYRTVGPPVIQDATVQVKRDAILEYIPEHVIPHPGSVLHQSLCVEMEGGSRAILYDAFAVGRVARGEQGRFSELTNRITVCYDGKLLFYDATELKPPSPWLSRVGGLAGFGYCAMFIVVSDTIRDWNGITHSLGETLDRSAAVLGGASALSRHGCIVRFVTYNAHECAETCRTLWAISRRLLLGLAEVDLRKW
jgi:urease accessory protein